MPDRMCEDKQRDPAPRERALKMQTTLVPTIFNHGDTGTPTSHRTCSMTTNFGNESSLTHVTRANICFPLSVKSS